MAFSFFKSHPVLLALIGRGVVIGLLAGGQIWLWPMVGAQATRWQELRRQDDHLRGLQEKLSVMETTYAQQKPLLEQITAVVPWENQVSQAVERLESLAATQGVTVQVKSIDSETKDRLVPVAITVQVNGPPAGLLSYLVAAERLPELAEVRSWDLQTVLQQQADGTSVGSGHVLNLTAVFYLQPLPLP